MSAKVDQLLHHREELCMEENSSNSPQVFLDEFVIPTDWSLKQFPVGWHQTWYFLSPKLQQWRVCFCEEPDHEICWLVETNSAAFRLWGISEILNVAFTRTLTLYRFSGWNGSSFKKSFYSGIDKTHHWGWRTRRRLDELDTVNDDFLLGKNFNLIKWTFTSKYTTICIFKE